MASPGITVVCFLLLRIGLLLLGPLGPQLIALGLERALRDDIGAEVLVSDPAQTRQTGHQKHDADDRQRRRPPPARWLATPPAFPELSPCPRHRGEWPRVVGLVLHDGTAHARHSARSRQFRPGRIRTRYVSVRLLLHCRVTAPPVGIPIPGASRRCFGTGTAGCGRRRCHRIPAHRRPAPAASVHRHHRPSPYPVAPRPRRKRPLGWLIGLGAVLVALIVVVVLVVQRIGGEEPDHGRPGGPALDRGLPGAGDGHGRSRSPATAGCTRGKLSYPELGSPWSAPEPEDRVAFGKGVLIQSVEIEKSPADQQWLRSGAGRRTGRG